jgi:hypothetical protein
MTANMFLKKDNFAYLFDICKRYLQDTKGIQVDDQELTQILVNEMRKLATDRSSSIDDLNKRTIVAVRETYLDNSSPSVSVAPQDDGDDQFFKKLQHLEVQRNVPLSAPVPAAVQPASPPPPNPPPPVLPPSTIIVQDSVAARRLHTTRSVVLKSWDRLWMYQHDRDVFVATIEGDVSHAKLSHIVVPATKRTMFVDVSIEGAGKQHQQVRVVPVYEDKHYVHYKPVDDNVAFVKMLSPPWIVTLKDCYGDPLGLGCDGWLIDHLLTKQNGNIVLSMSHSLSRNVMVDFEIGEQIRVQTQDGDVTQHEIVYTTINTLEIKSGSAKIHEGSWVMNSTRQSCLFFAIEQKNDV